jgi:DHA2 family methylenomycin A resistance protein-like MFS transporter
MARSRWSVLVVMCVGYFLVLLDVTIVNVALPRIGAGLGAGISGLQWVVDGYAVALASLLLAGGVVGDVLGHKRVVLSGLGGFGAASLVCAAAPSVGVLVAGRVAQGVGAALLLPGTLAIVSRAFPDKREQARAIGIWAAVGSAALPAGPLLGGLLVEAVGWRAVFFVNVPIVLVAGVAAARVVRESRVASSRRLDWPGVVLGGLLLASVTFAVIRAGHDGLDAVVVAAAAASVVLLVGFVAVEHSAADPMLPLGLLRRADFSTANVVAGTMNLGTLGLLFVLMLYLQAVQHRSALAAGAAVLPLFLPLSLIAPAAGRLTARVGPKLPMALGLVLAAAGVGLLVRVDPGSGYLTLLPAMLLWGCGLGVLTPAVVAAAVAALEPERAGLASGMNNTARQAGGAVGIAVFGAVAGSVARPAGFVAGLQTLGLATAGLYVAAAVLTLAVIPATRAA